MASLAEEIENVRLTELQDLEQASDTAAKRPHRLQIVCYQTGRFPTPEVKPYACVSACVCVCVCVDLCCKEEMSVTALQGDTACHWDCVQRSYQ